MEGHAKISTFEVMKMDPLTKLILEEMIDGKVTSLSAISCGYPILSVVGTTAKG